MAKRQRGGNAYKNGYQEYKLDNRQLKNKLRNMKRHIKKYPNDVQAQETLKKVEKSDYGTRKKPKAPNPVRPKSPVFVKRYFESSQVPFGEQLAEVLGIEFKRTAKPKNTGKTPVKYRKKKRNVKKPETIS